MNTKNKTLTILITLILFSLICISTVSAADINNTTNNQTSINLNSETQAISNNDNTTLLSTNSENTSTISSNNNSNTNIGSSISTFTDLSNAINQNSIVYLTSNITVSNNEINYYTNGISVGRTVTIEGNGYTINGLNSVRTFNVNHATLILKNLIINDCYSYSNGGSIFLNSNANLELYNVTFTDNSAKWGGAIYGIRNNKIIIENSNFNGNVATYGGSIYLNEGSMQIVSTIFNDSGSTLMGGAIGIENSNLIIDDSNFNACVSINSTGGGIYSIKTGISLSNTNFTDCVAQIGGGIAQLNNTLNIENCNFIGNSAYHYGGAIYNIYSNLNIYQTNFQSNVAIYGGALYVINASSLKLEKNKFENSTAVYGGAVFSFLNNDYTDLNNEYTGNIAVYGADFYNSDSPIVSISNNVSQTISANYTLFNGTLPDSYDLRNYDLVTSVKNQLTSGSCWAFATYAALESCLLKATNSSYDLSESNMKNLMALYSIYEYNNNVPNSGGTFEMAYGYLASWLGPINESTETYNDYTTVSSVLNNIFNIQDILTFTRTSYTDNNAIKSAILNYGAVAASIYMDESILYHNTYYYTGSSSANHAVCILGWDDNYSRYNFRNTPSGDGAFIVKNSWGTSWGDGGYFYVSYYDTMFAQVGKTNSFTFVLNNTNKYYKNYQYDYVMMTDWLVTGTNNVWYSVNYNSTGNDNLKAFSTYFNENTDYTAYIYVNDELVYTQTGYSLQGYHTIALNTDIFLNEGDNFAIDLNIRTNSSSANIPIQENETTITPIISGVSYFSYDGKTWYDLAEYIDVVPGHSYKAGQVACLKAFTLPINNYAISVPSITGIPKASTTVEVNVSDIYGNLPNTGTVTITVDGKDYTSNVTNGIANVNILLPETNGLNNITVTYSTGSESTTINSTILVNNSCTLTCNDLVKVYGVAANLTGKLVDAFNNPIIGQHIAIKLSNSNGQSKVYWASTDNKGEYQLEINLYPGEYTAQASFDGANIYQSVSTGVKNIVVTKSENSTVLVANKFVEPYGANMNFTGVLTNYAGSPLIGQHIAIKLSNSNGQSKVYWASTDNKGEYQLEINLYAGNYRAECSYSGTSQYEPSSASTTITVTS